jgi:peptide/nickel transport system substrate-binding protein
MEPLFEIGRYGGEFRTSMMDPRIEGADTSTIHFQPLFKVDIEDFRPKPNIVKGYDMSDDGRVLTLTLRRGMKWSDGEPFTADDFMFWYQSILLDDEIMPVKPSRWAPGGDVVQMQKIDDTTVRFTFAEPYFPVLNMLAVGPSSTLQEPFKPAHYLKKWHIAHNSQANAVAREEGYDSWSKAFTFHANLGTTETRHDTGAPGVSSWVLNRVEDNGNKYFTRNPYYWKIDTAGNQLPYVDRQVAVLYQSAEVVSLNAIGGELTTAGVQVSLKNYTMYRENEEKGGYTTYLWAGGKGAERIVSFNVTHPDPVLRNIFGDVRFRQAMSLAINREEMNEVIYFGRGIPRQATVTPNASFYEDWMGEYYADCDPDRANALLDEMGLKKGGDGFRLRPDGKPLVVTMGFFPLGGETGLVPQLLTENWNDVGVKTVVTQYERSF